ncbi:MAG: START domain-containing protein [Bacteroidia bacterium]|nr:START domain-containing protein [Bacteroidia bacterium]
MKTLKLFLFILIPFLGLFIIVPPWKTEYEKNGITVSTRKLEGYSIKEFKGETRMHTNLGSLVRIFESVPTYQMWAYNCKNAAMVRKFNANKGRVHVVLKMPWPIKNRDVVYDYEIIQNKVTKTVVMNVQSVSDSTIATNGNVRMKFMESTYILTPLANNLTNVEFSSISDPDVGIPISVINLFIADAPYYT